MDFEYTFDKSDTSISSLEARGFLWVMKYLITEIKLDFDPRLSNRLRLSSTILSEVLIDIGYLTDASVLSKTNVLHKKSLGSLLNWLFDYLDGRQAELVKLLPFLKSLVSKISFQVKIYPTAFICAYCNYSTDTKIFARIRSATRQSHRLQHLLDFDALVVNAESQSGWFLNQGLIFELYFFYIFHTSQIFYFSKK